MTKLLLTLCLILLAMNVYNSKTLETRNQEIITLSERQETAQKRLDSVVVQLDSVSNSIDQANASWNRLNEKLQALEKSKSKYPEKVQEIKNENKETKALLDTMLTDDLKRLLNESIQGGRSN